IAALWLECCPNGIGRQPVDRYDVECAECSTNPAADGRYAGLYPRAKLGVKTGFGTEDSRAFANSLRWGPDGWLYGARGSTVTAMIRGIEIQQAARAVIGRRWQHLGIRLRPLRQSHRWHGPLSHFR